MTDLAKRASKSRQVDILRKAFDAGERLTFLESVQRYGILALSQRCTDLRREGYPVESEMIALPNGKRVALYSKLIIPYG